MDEGRDQNFGNRERKRARGLYGNASKRPGAEIGVSERLLDDGAAKE
jgi:hypothetical protein